MDAGPTRTGWWKRLEARMDAWAARRLTPDEYADATELDRKMKLHFWRGLAVFALGSALATAFTMAIWPTLGWTRAFVYSGTFALYLLFTVSSPFYGYRKWSRSPAWRIFLVFTLLALVGGAGGFAVAMLRPGKSFADIDPEKLARAVAIALLLGMACASLLVGVSRLRLREAVERAARMQAQTERERLERQGVQAELKLLQAQVEPHFLFNTLANVRHLVQTGSADALPMLDHLIHYLRTSLPELRCEGSTLEREAELARSYLEIIRMRMGAGLEIAIDVPAELARTPFPPLMLMTLVENAVKHGVAPAGRGRIAVHAERTARGVVVKVSDDGRGLMEPIGQGVGLANIRERLRALHGEAARLELASREDGGTVAAIEVPR